MAGSISVSAADKVGIILMHGKKGNAVHMQLLAADLRDNACLAVAPDMPWSRSRAYDRLLDEAHREIDGLVELLRQEGAARTSLPDTAWEPTWRSAMPQRTRAWIHQERLGRHERIQAPRTAGGVACRLRQPDLADFGGEAGHPCLRSDDVCRAGRGDSRADRLPVQQGRRRPGRRTAAAAMPERDVSAFSTSMSRTSVWWPRHTLPAPPRGDRTRARRAGLRADPGA